MGRNFPVQTHGELGGNERLSGYYMLGEGLVKLGSGVGFFPYHRYTRSLQLIAAPSSHRWVWVDGRYVNLLDTRGNDGLGAWWCASLVAAGLQGGVEGGAVSTGIGLIQGDYFRVFLTRRKGMPFSDYAAVLDNNRPHRRVWAG